jgi:hypothetical protein
LTFDRFYLTTCCCAYLISVSDDVDPPPSSTQLVQIVFVSYPHATSQR